MDAIPDTGTDPDTSADTTGSLDPSTEGGGACVPGQSSSCTCTGADVGVQVCRSDGSGYEPCACEGTDTGSTSSTGETTDTGSTSETTDTGSTSETTDTGSTSETTDTGSTSETTDTGSTSETGETSDTGGACGDGAIDPGEACDDAGESAACDGDCTLAACGDAYVNAAAGELCDGDALAGATCQSQGFTAGVLACAPDCSAHDTSGCADPPGAPVLVLSVSPIKQFDFSWAAVADADHYQLEESIAPGEPFVPLGGDVVGTSISHTMPLHLRHQASYRLRACNVAGCTDSAVVDVASSLAEAVGYFKASNTDADDYFGHVALSADGNTLAVGSTLEDSSATGIDGDQANEGANGAGAVYVFVRDGMGTWSQAAYVKASNTDPNDAFGGRVALSADGSTLAVGAQLEDGSATGIDGDHTSDGAPDSGAVYVFARDPMGAWSQQAYVKASNTDVLDWFGSSVALSDDGDTLAVGATGEDSGATGIDGDQMSDAASNTGAVYVFVRDDMGTWSQQAYVKASNTDAGDLFGSSVALSGDGVTLAVGAIGERSNATGIDGNQGNNLFDDAGAVYVFVRDDMGAWSQQAYVKASNTDADDLFGGRGLSLSADGSTLAVGAHQEDGSATGIDGDQTSDAASNAGAVYVFVRDGMGTWSQEAYVKASNTDAGDSFGVRLDLGGNGNVLAVGASQEDGSATGVDGDQTSDAALDAGAVYVLVRDGTGTWSQAAYVKASNAGTSDMFGIGVALSEDAGTLAVGAFQESGSATGLGGDQASDLAVNSGAVYLY